MPCLLRARSLVLGLLALALVACTQPAPAPTAVPQPTVAATTIATTVPATATPLAVPTSAATAGIQRTDAELAAKLDDFLTKMTKESLFSGIVTVKRNQTVVFQKGYGLADRTKQTAFTPQTVFRVGELNMQFTAAATLLLEQQGKLKVEDPICTYIENCLAAWKPITIHHLLSHTSGIPNYIGTTAGDALGKSGATNEQIVALIRDKPLQFAPGAKRMFSHSGFVLLGLVIERASGQSYGDFMRSQVFTPLGMQHSGYGNPNEPLALGYMIGPSDTPTTYNVSALGAAGGLYTTSEDMLRWTEGLYSKKLLNATELEKMLTNHASFGDKNDLGSGYGIVLDVFEGHRDTGQCGGPLGYGSCVTYLRDDAITIIHLGNQDNVDIFTISDTLEKIVLGLT